MLDLDIKKLYGAHENFLYSSMSHPFGISVVTKVSETVPEIYFAVYDRRNPPKYQMVKTFKSLESAVEFLEELYRVAVTK